MPEARAGEMVSQRADRPLLEVAAFVVTTLSLFFAIASFVRDLVAG